jgi:hypothetical protein
MIKQAMVIVVFVLGVALVIAALVALFRNSRAGEGEVTILGIKISGKGSAVFLLAGIVLMMSAYGWQDSLEKVKTLSVESRQTAGTALDLNKKVSQLEEANRTLANKLPPAQTEEVKRTSPQILMQDRKLSLPPSQVQKLERIQRRE